MRKAAPTEDGEWDGEERPDSKDPTKIWVWSDDDETWYEYIPVGTRKYDETLGYIVEWNGSEWVKATDQGDPTNTPIGDAPWHWMLLLMAIYGGAKVWKRNKTKNLI